MKETDKAKKKRLELSNEIDLRDMIRDKNMTHGTIVNREKDVLCLEMIHTFNRKDRRRMLKLEKQRRNTK